jgi:hypothetical protein
VALIVAECMLPEDFDCLHASYAIEELVAYPAVYKFKELAMVRVFVTSPVFVPHTKYFLTEVGAGIRVKALSGEDEDCDGQRRGKKY